ncbi:hypothetical protein V8E54_014557 [Elaphomyces granulatus]
MLSEDQAPMDRADIIAPERETAYAGDGIFVPDPRLDDRISEAGLPLSRARRRGRPRGIRGTSVRKPRWARMAFRNAICEDLPITIKAFQRRRPDLRLSYSVWSISTWRPSRDRGINSTASPPPTCRQFNDDQRQGSTGSSLPSRRVRRPGTFLYRAVYGHLHGKSADRDGRAPIGDWQKGKLDRRGAVQCRGCLTPSTCLPLRTWLPVAQRRILTATKLACEAQAKQAETQPVESDRLASNKSLDPALRQTSRIIHMFCEKQFLTSPVQGFCDSFGSSVLQNSVGLQLFPGHPIWKADVFSSEAYQAFAAQVAAASEAGKEPEDLQIMKVLPILLRSFTVHADSGSPSSTSYLANSKKSDTDSAGRLSRSRIYDKNGPSALDRDSRHSIQQHSTRVLGGGIRMKGQFYSHRLPIIKIIQRPAKPLRRGKRPPSRKRRGLKVIAKEGNYEYRPTVFHYHPIPDGGQVLLYRPGVITDSRVLDHVVLSPAINVSSSEGIPKTGPSSRSTPPRSMRAISTAMTSTLVWSLHARFRVESHENC